MRMPLVVAIVLSIPVLSASCVATARVVPNPAPRHRVVFQSESRLCSEATTVGDTVRAHLVSGGESLVPRLEVGSPALFMLSDFRVAQLGDSASRPIFSLQLVALGNEPTPGSLHGEPVGIDYRVRADSSTGHWYICVLPISKIFVGDFALHP